ncbi:MAG TPA: FAD-dependent oxidoreductase, partial [Streptosporangiaceae bacterium]
VGMGFIGCEVAASLIQLGVQVTTVFPGKEPLERVLGGQVGGVVGAFHRAHGVDLRPGEQVTAFEGAERLSTSTRSSTSAMSPGGTSSWSAAAWTRGS